MYRYYAKLVMAGSVGLQYALKKHSETYTELRGGKNV
jgi:hypothetical protein